MINELAWDGYPNARDLGGLPTSLAGGGKTIPGRLARGPRRERLNILGWNAARHWGLSTIVDLRCAYESGAQAADPVVPAEALAGFTIRQAPTEDHEDPEFRQMCFPILDSPEYWSHNWRLQPHLVKAALDAIATATPGVLVHCSAGRDRTGMICALLLGNAGVEPDFVAADYAASVRVMAGVANHSPTVDQQAEWTRNQVDSWLTDKLPLVREVAGGVQEIFDVLKVGTATRESLRSLLVDP